MWWVGSAGCCTPESIAFWLRIELQPPIELYLPWNCESLMKILVRLFEVAFPEVAKPSWFNNCDWWLLPLVDALLCWLLLCDKNDRLAPIWEFDSI